MNGVKFENNKIFDEKFFHSHILHLARQKASELLSLDPKLQHVDNVGLNKLILQFEEKLSAEIN